MKRKVLVSMLCASMIGSMMTGMTVSADEPVTLDLYLDFTWFPTDSWTGIIPETLTENGGVTFDVTRSADDSQLGLMIASGDLPDVIFTDKEIDRLSDSNLCYSYDELIEQYGVDWTPSDDRIAIARSHNASADDEHYYTIIQNYNSADDWANAADGVVPTIPCAYYRKDIWEALGSPKMDTIEDVINVLKMVKEQYPDMIPLNGGNPSWRFQAMQVWYGVNGTYIFDEDGNTVLSDTTADYHDYLKCINDMYREGFFPEEDLAITNEDDAKQLALNGKCFMYEWCARPTHLDQLNTSTQQNIPEAEWAPLAPLMDDSKGLVRSNAGWAGVFISKNCKDPEAAIKMIAYMNSSEGQHLAMWGREGTDWTLGDNGMPSFSDEWVETAKDGDKMNTVYNNNYYMCTTELDELYAYYSSADPEIVEIFGKNSDKITNYPEIAIAQPVSTSDMGIIKAKIDEAKPAELVKIYTADSDEAFEEAYQNYMNLLDKIGVQELNSYMTEKVKEVREQFGF